jgi:hypothetical protein
MSIFFIDKTNSEVECHIGDANQADLIEPCNVEIVQADGQELELMRSMFGDTIPDSHQRIQYWYGDTAKAVAAAFKSKLIFPSKSLDFTSKT